MKLTIALTSTGLTLSAQLYDTAGVATGAPITTGFTEIGGGSYVLDLDLDPDFEGHIAYENTAAPGVVLAGEGINIHPFAHDRTSFASLVGTLGETYATIIGGATVMGDNTVLRTYTNLTATLNDAYLGRTIVFTSGALTGIAAAITAYNATGNFLTHTEIPAASSATDTFLII